MLMKVCVGAISGKRIDNSGVIHARSGVSRNTAAARSPQLLWWV